MYQLSEKRNIEYINSLSEGELSALIDAGKCPYEPEHLKGQPIGMLHCPVCGEMVLAGMKHLQPIDWESPEVQDDLERLDRRGTNDRD